MAFFPRTFYNTTADAASFTPLFRLLDDFDKYSRQGCGTQQNVRRPAPAQWQPKFDIRETAEAYELYGELAGVSKENVHIEFTEPQTLQIRGKSERTYSAGTSPAVQIDDAPASDAASNSGESVKSAHQATVEDDNEADSNDSNFEVVDSPEEKKQPEQPADKAKYWLTERSLGEFSRSFNFPSRVDQDAVSASFVDGVLSISVPKAKKHESRRISVL